MRVLAVTHEASRTGAVRALVEALPVLRQFGTELVVVNKTPGPMSPDLRSHSDVLLEAPRPRLSQCRRISRVRALDQFVPTIDRAIARSVIREACPDLVYASTVMSADYAAVAQQLHIPVVLHVHEAQPLSGWALRRSGVDLRTLPMAAPSLFTARELEQLSGRSVPVLLGPTRAVEPMDPLESVESVEATPLLDVPWTPGSVRVVGCGSLAPWKGPDLWLDAAERLSTVDGRRVEWMWIGAGDQLRFLRDETRQRGLEHRVHWMGERENVGPYLASGDLFVLTSRIEPLGLVLLEAAAAGVASIAFQTGGVREILVDERALVRAGNVGELVEKIRSALKSLALRSQLLEASRPALVESDPEVWRRHLAQVVAEAVRGEPAATPVP